MEFEGKEAERKSLFFFADKMDAVDNTVKPSEEEFYLLPKFPRQTLIFSDVLEVIH